ncbi:putative fatty acid synthase subunit protein [Neofusicoccum parvum UCRNP2]|uniref:beta-ketoacyl-[acyl-carrier-protein] synthase I n=1 Tax=Botryosphaeria parva (strain UCR-NP2) TaxID=1287680 RepID=R1ER31_BOTPV|nr:putative fatty acid synthase subunit protein [Neofusicoccum parvum UCRNP2]
MTLDQDLAHEAVVELLAHQFAYPVKWIDTQDVLLGQQKKERVVEIGPSNTLTVMAKRTVASQLRDHDDAQWIRRDLLACEDDTEDVYFQRDPPAPGASTAAVDEAAAERPQSQTVVDEPAVVPAPAASRGPASKKADEPVTAKAILRAMIAQKLKKRPEEIQDQDSIKALAGGRSTLENEIVGDLVSEFGSVPERAEDVGVAALGDALQRGFRGSLGAQAAAMVEKLMGAKMPGGFAMSEARAHLDARWGLACGRQDSVLLAAAADPPPARLPDPPAARAFLDAKARRHLLDAGLPVDDPAPAHQNAAPSVDPEALRSITRDQEAFNRRQLELYARQLGVDLQAGLKASENAVAAAADLQDQLDLWNTEHGDAYASGIRPIFDPRKARSFDSSWAWVIQDAFTLFHRLLHDAPAPDDAEVQQLCNSISQRSTPKLLEALRYLQGICQKDSTDRHKAAEHAITSLIGRCETQQIPSFVFPAPVGGSSPCTHQIRRKSSGEWVRDEEATHSFHEVLRAVQTDGLSFVDRTVLITGAGRGSIGAEILGGLLAGGAKVIVTTSSYSSASINAYRDVYVNHAGPGSRLVVVPFNQGSQSDVEALVSYIYDRTGLGWDLDAVVPFAAISEGGREVDTIDSKSELAHRVMLTNVIRLVGAIKRHKQGAGYDTRPAQVILPLSANHGIFGGDGLYAESKIALETLFNKWYSESWSDYLSIGGAAIGWTRGTGLMKGNDLLAEEVEKLGIKTFSQSEMAANILALLDPEMMEAMEERPLYADFNGGLDTVHDLSERLRQIRKNITDADDIKRALAAEESLDNSEMAFDDVSEDDDAFFPRANIGLGFPDLPDFQSSLKPLGKLHGMVDLESVVVVAGFSELGPWGSARTRWEMEARGTFSLEGWVEMAWIMGLIKYAEHPTWQGIEQPAGWVDAKSSEPIQDHEIEGRYGEHIKAHAGIRIVEPELWDGYDPEKKQFFQEVVMQEDMEPFETSKDTAEAFKRRHGDHADVLDGKVYIKKGATLLIPKAAKFSHNVAGQIPTGFNPRTYGISEDIISQVDPITLYSLVCTVEALFSAGITDPYEIYQYIHASELGNCVGTGVGGVASAARMYKGRSMEKDVPKDVLQETFLNTVGAWINMLLLSSNGPIRTPVGACATAIESLDTAHDLIMTGKAKFCLVGGVDDLEEHMAYEFANMKATNNNELDAAHGRAPNEMSRPAASDRRGFLESHGCGLQVVCTAKLALEMGLPVYGILAFTGTASDKVGRSVPAPGKGVMVNVRERPAAFASPLLSLDYRRRQMTSRRSQIHEFKELELAQLEDEMAAMDIDKDSLEEYRTYREQHINSEAARQESDALRAFGNNFWRHHPEIAPIRGALATWGLSIDDLQVASFHGTSTIKNEQNECEIMQRQLTHLGRTRGNRILGVFQKYLTGHPKGAAGAWMLNGCLQIMHTGLVPGNRNADNIDPYLEQFDHIAFVNKSIQTTGIKAASVFSFGFGQKGTQAIVVHPKYLFAVLDEAVYDVYKRKTLQRRRVATAEFQQRMLNGTLFIAKDVAPFQGKREAEALIDPTSRLSSS